VEPELHDLRDRIVPHQTIYLGSSTTDLPLDVFDTHFLASLVVVVVPLAFRKINGFERCVRFHTLGLEVALGIQISSDTPIMPNERDLRLL
jgi:hypothetical protein